MGGGCRELSEAWPGVEAPEGREPEAGASRAGAARLGREPAALHREASLMPAGALRGRAEASRRPRGGDGGSAGRPGGRALRTILLRL